MIRITEEKQLLQQLQIAFPEISRTRLKQYLQNGRVLVNGKSVTQFDHMLHPGDTIDIGQSQPRALFPQNSGIRLVYEDRHLVVIDKQEGILSMATSHHSLCVKTVLDNYFERSRQRCHAHLVHRLDRETSGLMIFAKSRTVQQLFEQDWKGFVYDRRYVAVALGHIQDDEGTIRSWLKDNRQYVTYSSPVDNGGKLAVTHYRVLQRGAENTLVEARLDTGRKNQIRVHLRDLGHPVVGDNKYGLQSKAHRLCLHAYRLHFVHPVTGERLQFDTPIPKEFLNVL